jgi:hypothetical protein
MLGGACWWSCRLVSVIVVVASADSVWGVLPRSVA